MSTVITIRVDRRLKEQLEKYHIAASRVAREALEEEVRRREIEEAKKSAEDLGALFACMTDEKIVESIKQTRRAR